MASVALNLLNVPLAVELDPRLQYAPIAIRVNPNSWLALSADEAEALSRELSTAVANLRGMQTGNTGIDPGTYTGTPATADGHAAPIGNYPPETWPTCSPVVDSLGHGFDRRAAA